MWVPRADRKWVDTNHDLHVNLIPILAPNNLDYFKIGFDNLITNY